MPQPYVAIDTETEYIEPGCSLPRQACLTYAEDSANPQLVASHVAAAVLASRLEDGWTIVGHNVAFDFLVTLENAKEGIRDHLLGLVFLAYAEGRVRDTMVREQLLAIRAGSMKFDVDSEGNATKTLFNLGVLAKRYLGLQLDKAEDSIRYRYGALLEVHPEEWPPEARDYATADASATLRVFLAQGPDRISPDEEDQVRAAFALAILRAWGLRTHPERVERLRVRLEAERLSLMTELADTGLVRLTGSKKALAAGQGKVTRDLKAIKARVQDSLGDRVQLTDKGNVVTDRRTLLLTKDSGLRKLAEVGKVEKYLSTYVPTLRAGTERPINPHWNNLVESGRTSCASPNVQNVPREGGIRECFVPRPGRVYVGCDYSIAELRALAEVLVEWFGSSAMADALNAGRELHLDVAAQLAGVSYEEALRLHHTKDPGIKAKRQLAKALNFGLPGGLGPDSFVEFAEGYKVHLTVDEARDLKATWLGRFPEMGPYFQRIASIVGDLGEGSIEQLYSRRVRGGVSFCAAANTMFQGLVADHAKAALWDVVVACFVDTRSALYGARPVLFVHDEIIVESEEDRASAAAVELERLMVEAGRRYITHVPVLADPFVSRCWSKEATAIKDAQGQLVPWDVPAEVAHV